MSTDPQRDGAEAAPPSGVRAPWLRAASVTRRFPVTAARVWEVMATPGLLARYHPFCSANPVAAWPGVGARDSIVYRSGLVLHRRFVAWDEGRGYELEIGSGRGPVSVVRWELAAAGAEACRLTISIWPAAYVRHPMIVRRALYRGFVLPQLRRYLRSVLRGLEQFATSGRDVAPNQFGRVRPFSHGRRRRGRPHDPHPGSDTGLS